MEKSGLSAFENFQYRMALQKDGVGILSKLNPADFACETPSTFAAQEGVEGYQPNEYLENWGSE